MRLPCSTRISPIRPPDSRCLSKSCVELFAGDESLFDGDLAERASHLLVFLWLRLHDVQVRSVAGRRYVAICNLVLRPLLGKHTCELEPPDAEPGHDDLSEPVAGRLLKLQSLLELLRRDQVLLDEDGADQA